MGYKHLFCFLAILKVISAQSYIAAVLEYSPELRDASVSDEQYVLLNVQRYRQFIQQAATRNANIIVFPEYGLTTTTLPFDLVNSSTLVPQANASISPCDNSTNYAKFFVDLSCLAREHRIHTVVNLVERDVRNDTNETIFYNTNVVFDTNGTVIARYRKINLSNEPQFTPGNEVVTFRAFDVTFGLFTCFDILFKVPAQEVLKDATDIIFPTAWTSETPFLQGLSIQDGYAKAAGVNLLVSGYNNVRAGIAGAGVFLANGTIGGISIAPASIQNAFFATIPRINQRTPQAVCDNNVISPPSITVDVYYLHLALLVSSQVDSKTAAETDNINTETLSVSPRFGVLPDLSSVFNVQHENMKNYTFQALEQNVNDTRGEICSEDTDFCCSYYIEFNTPLNSNSTVYKMAAFYGSRGFQGVNANSRTIGVRTCALVSCTSPDDSTCGKFNGTSNVNFRLLSITTTLQTNPNTFYQPSTLTYDHQPLTNYTYCTNEDAGVFKITMNAENVQSLFSFGIFGRMYENDGQPEGRGGAANIQLSLQLIVAMVAAYLSLMLVY